MWVGGQNAPLPFRLTQDFRLDDRLEIDRQI